MIVTAVEALTALVEMAKTRRRRPAGDGHARRHAGHAGLLLESDTVAPAAGAAPDSVTTPCAPEPPATLSGLATSALQRRPRRVGAPPA